MLLDMREHNSDPFTSPSMKCLPKLTISQKSVQQIVSSLVNHRINTLTELCRVERLAASCDREIDARAFQEPMTAAWVHYITSHQFLVELRGFTRNYPFSGDVITEARTRVYSDPESNRSWNLAWLCLMKMRDDQLISSYAAVEAAKPSMWGSMEPDEEQIAQLAACFAHEWSEAVDKMLRHWTHSPTWY